MPLGWPDARIAGAAVARKDLCALRALASLCLLAVRAPGLHDLVDAHCLYLEFPVRPAIAQQVPFHPVVQSEPQPGLVAQRAGTLVCNGLRRHGQRHKAARALPGTRIPAVFRWPAASAATGKAGGNRRQDEERVTMQLEYGIVTVIRPWLPAHWPDFLPVAHAGSTPDVCRVGPAERHFPAVAFVHSGNAVASKQRGERVRAAPAATHDEQICCPRPLCD